MDQATSLFRIRFPTRGLFLDLSRKLDSESKVPQGKMGLRPLPRDIVTSLPVASSRTKSIFKARQAMSFWPSLVCHVPYGMESYRLLARKSVAVREK